MTRAPLDLGAALAGLLTVVAANLLYFTGMSRVFDPMMSMDPFYIHLATRPMGEIVGQDPGCGPLFALWLKPFVAALGDPVAVYAANVCVLSVGVSVFLYLHVLLLTRRVAAAAGAALFFLVSDFNVPLAGKVGDFALLVVLAGLTAAELVPAGARRTSVVAVGVLLAGHARPELYPAVPILCVVALRLAVRESRASGASVFVWPVAALGTAAALALWLGTPLFSPSHGNERFPIAFREHFAWNWSRWTNQAGSFLSIWQKSSAMRAACSMHSRGIRAPSRTTSSTISSAPPASWSRPRSTTTRCSLLSLVRHG